MAADQSPSTWRVADVLVATLLAAGVAGFALQRSATLHPVLYQYTAHGVRTSDTWFDADIPRAACLITDRHASQHRATSRHPLISVLMHGPAALLQAVMPVPAVTAIRRVSALNGAAWIVALYLLLRRLGSGVPDATLFALVAAVSAAGLFWTAVPELHTLGAVTLLVPLFLVARPDPRSRTSDAALLVASCVSLSVTLTNWISGLAAAAVERGWRAAVQPSINALVIVSLLWGIQSRWFPASQYFSGGAAPVVAGLDLEPRPFTDLLLEELEVLPAFFSHTIVMPALAVHGEPGQAREITAQMSWPGSSGPIGVMATAIWLAVLGYGAWLLRRAPARRPLKIVLAITVLAQLAVHLIVGEETFLYSIQFAPLLIAVAAFAVTGPYANVVRAFTIALVVTAGANNLTQFATAARIVDEIGQERAAAGAVFQAADACR